MSRAFAAPDTAISKFVNYNIFDYPARPETFSAKPNSNRKVAPDAHFIYNGIVEYDIGV